MLTISLIGLVLLVLLLWAGFLGKYWDQNVPGADEGGWRRRFAVATSCIWFPVGKDLWSMAMIFVMLAIGPIFLYWTFAGVERQQSEAPVGHITIPGDVVEVKILNRRSSTVLFDWAEFQKLIKKGKVEKVEEIGGGLVRIVVRDRGALWSAISHNNAIYPGKEVYIRTAFLRQGRGDNSNEPLYWIISREEARALLQFGFKIE